VKKIKFTNLLDVTKENIEFEFRAVLWDLIESLI